MCLPVCSPGRSFQSYDTAKSGGSKQCPCDIPPGKDHCGDSTFENQSIDASLKVEDCRAIIRTSRATAAPSEPRRLSAKLSARLSHLGLVPLVLRLLLLTATSNSKPAGKMLLTSSAMRLQSLVGAARLEQR
jgi:hypothetical protein